MAWWSRAFRGLNKAEEIINILIVLLMVMAVFLQVVYRYVFNSPLTWTEEFARLMFVWLNIFGASIVFRYGGHVSFDFLTSTFLRGKGILVKQILINVLVFGFLLYVIIPGIRQAESVNTVASAALGWPLSLFYYSLPVAALVIMLNLLNDTVHKLKQLLNRGEASR